MKKSQCIFPTHNEKHTAEEKQQNESNSCQRKNECKDNLGQYYTEIFLQKIPPKARKNWLLSFILNLFCWSLTNDINIVI